jgi:hypothetical protein
LGINPYETANGWIPRDKESGFAFLHDLGGGYHETKILCEQAIETNYPNVFSKFLYLGAKTDLSFSEVANVKLIFFGKINATDLELFNDCAIRRYGRMLEVINILDVSERISELGAQNISTLFVNDLEYTAHLTPKEKWKGNNESWFNALITVV